MQHCERLCVTELCDEKMCFNCNYLTAEFSSSNEAISKFKIVPINMSILHYHIRIHIQKLVIAIWWRAQPISAVE